MSARALARLLAAATLLTPAAAAGQEPGPAAAPPAPGTPAADAAGLLAEAPGPSGPTLEVRLAPGPHTVGDRIEAVLTVTLPASPTAGVEPEFPDWGTAWGEAEVIAVGEVERFDGEDEAGDRRPRFRQRLEMAAFRPGELALPPVGVRVPDGGGELALTTPRGLALTVDSVLPPPGEAAEPEPMPPAPPRPLPAGAAFWWTAAAGAAACALALAWALRRRRAPATAAAGAPPPFEELRAALAAARREPVPETGHTRLSLALRRYLGRSLGFPAAESSTAEVRRRLASRHLPEGAARRAAALLAGCDLIKFARRPATAEELSERADAALGLASEIETHLRPAPADDAGTGAARPEAA